MSVRRYLAVIQAPEGYPGPNDPLEPAPPDGPALPVLHTVVREEAFETLEAEVARLRPVVAQIASLAVQNGYGYARVPVGVIDAAREAITDA
jgi:hypothetical protein